MKKKICLLAVGIINLFWMKTIMALTLGSPVFQQDEKIPKIYTCDGNNISPALYWKDAPSNTKSFVLIMDDPDAPIGIWDHWILYNIPPTTTSLEENIQTLPQGAKVGKNSWNKLNYGGPCPPDKEHRYFFKLYAIDTTLPNNIQMTKKDVEKAMEGHVIAFTQLIAKYKR